MAKKYSHQCLKCKEKYQDVDPDPYMCQACQDAKSLIAKEIDKKFGSTAGQEPNSGYVAYEKLRKEKGVRGFVPASALGIQP